MNENDIVSIVEFLDFEVFKEMIKSNGLCSITCIERKSKPHTYQIKKSYTYFAVYNRGFLTCITDKEFDLEYEPKPITRIKVRVDKVKFEVMTLREFVKYIYGSDKE